MAVSKASLKVALDEKLLEPQPAQLGTHRNTARGEAFLFAQQGTSKADTSARLRFSARPNSKLLTLKT